MDNQRRDDLLKESQKMRKLFGVYRDRFFERRPLLIDVGLDDLPFYEAVVMEFLTDVNNRLEKIEGSLAGVGLSSEEVYEAEDVTEE